MRSKLWGVITATLVALTTLFCGQADAQMWSGVSNITASCNPTQSLTMFSIVGAATISTLTGSNPGPGHQMKIDVSLTAFPWGQCWNGSKIGAGYTCEGVVNTGANPTSVTATGNVVFPMQASAFFRVPIVGIQDSTVIYNQTPLAECVQPAICQQNPASCGGSPVIIPLHALPGGPNPDGNQGNQIHLTDAAHGVVFDIFGDGNPVQVAWTADDQSGFLAIDRDGDGMITSGKELFGNHTLPNSDNGFYAIAKLLMGDHPDGVFSNTDKNFDKLLIWVDRNHNGISEPDELISANKIITQITTGSMPSGKKDKYGNQFRAMGKVKYVGLPQDDSLDNWRPVYDVTLKTLPD